uniref:Downstream neighbor of SON n=1 Tax=Neogobius melanostomus TaxID=47308 RepID=A0A8C6X044_9GOBI
MSEQAGYSPSFKRPADIMRMRRKRARTEAGSFSGSPAAASSAQGASSPASVRPFSPGPLFNCQNRSGGGVKRRNPFANIENTFSPSKKLIIYNEEEGHVEAKDQKDSGQLSTKRNEELPFTPSCHLPGLHSAPVCTEYPSDWSLKTRLLFTSPLPLSWAEKPKAQEEAMGLVQHCRAHFSAVPHSVQSLVYWQHPTLPWLSLFPRINAERSFTGKSAPWSSDTALQQSLMSETAFEFATVLFDSLYQATPLFSPFLYHYIFQFTVLFRAVGLSGSSNITALISPTTRGLREAMKADGIEFSLPLVEEQRKSRDFDEELDNNDDEDMSWLKEMGVQDKIKKPDIAIQIRKEGQAVSLDHKPESVVLVEGPDTFTLINFLINCKSLVASAGSQAGLPPTLLAPVAFRGAAVQTLKARSVNVKSQVGMGYQNISSLEITGPILPSALHGITSLLRPAQKGNFSATLYTHAPTAVMNTHQSSAQVTHTMHKLQTPSTLGKTALSHINMNNYSYTWKN